MQHKTLAQLIEQNQQLDCIQKYNLFKNICHQIEKHHLENKTYKYLSPEYIIVDNNMNVQLKELEETPDIKRLVNWVYLSPEVQKSFNDPQNCEITTQADIWSIGLLLNVVFTMKRPIQVRQSFNFSSYSDYFIEIIHLCMKLKPEERASSSQLCSFFQDFETNYLHTQNYDMRLAYECFKQERQISSTIKLQKLDSTILNEEFDELEIKSRNHHLDDIILEYRNFSFHALSKNDNQSLYLLIQDRPLKINQNKIIKADDYEIIISNIDMKEGNIDLQIRQHQQESFESYSFQLNNDEFLSIGADEDNQIYLPNLSADSSLQIFKQKDGFYVQQYSNQTDSSLSSNESGRVYIKLEKNTPIFNQSIICSENQRYFVKSIC